MVQFMETKGDEGSSGDGDGDVVGSVVHPMTSSVLVFVVSRSDSKDTATK